ncbi:MAG: hypothetical protein LBM21_03335, partial [Coriobacteriales bacterium]|nr:hypothetical protein [Coriobacteriales bacterium]
MSDNETDTTSAVKPVEVEGMSSEWTPSHMRGATADTSADGETAGAEKPHAIAKWWRGVRDWFAKYRKRILIILGIIIGALIVIYVALAVLFMFRFSIGTTVNGVNAMFKTPDEVEAAVSDNASTYQLEITKIDGSSATINGQDVGLTYTPCGQVATLLSPQDAFTWPVRLFTQPNEYVAYDGMSLDNQKLTTIVDGLPCMLPANMTPPKDAYPELVNGSWQIHA